MCFGKREGRRRGRGLLLLRVGGSNWAARWIWVRLRLDGGGAG